MITFLVIGMYRRRGPSLSSWHFSNGEGRRRGLLISKLCRRDRAAKFQITTKCFVTGCRSLRRKLNDLDEEIMFFLAGAWVNASLLKQL